ncbi:MAG: amidohydrolase family protein [Burkholderiales bacterium]
MLSHIRETRLPSRPPPPGSCDCHFHVFGDTVKYPPKLQRTYEPPAANFADLRRMHDTLGISRGVIVQPAVYGTDNRLLSDSLVGQANYRGVAAIDDSVSDDELARLNRAGVRGIRFQLSGATDMAMVNRCIERIRPLGWQVKLGGSAEDLLRHAQSLRALDIPVVIDHLGTPDFALGLDQLGFRFVLEMLTRDNWWILLSNGDRRSLTGPPWSDVAPYVRAALAVAPSRALWASDWPHLLYAKPEVPNDGDLLELLYRLVPDQGLLEKILVENPAKLYGFGN